MAPQIVTEVQLETLPDGLYQVGNKGSKKALTPRRQTGTYYDFLTNDMKTGPMVLMARVKAAGSVPQGVNSVTIRGDGKQVITQWVGDPAATATPASRPAGGTRRVPLHKRAG